MNLKPITARQAKLMAKRFGNNSAFSCYIEAPNGFYGLSTVMYVFGNVMIFAPHKWNAPPRAA